MSDKRQRIANILDELDTEPEEPILSRAIPRGTVRGPTETENPIESTADQAFNVMFGWMNVGSDADKATATEMDDLDLWALWRNPTTKAQREMLETRLSPWLTARVSIGRGYLLPDYVKQSKCQCV